jgi:hypothetical protein
MDWICSNLLFYCSALNDAPVCNGNMDDRKRAFLTLSSVIKQHGLLSEEAYTSAKNIISVRQCEPASFSTIHRGGDGVADGHAQRNGRMKKMLFSLEELQHGVVNVHVSYTQSYNESMKTHHRRLWFHAPSTLQSSATYPMPCCNVIASFDPAQGVLEEHANLSLSSCLLYCSDPSYSPGISTIPTTANGGELEQSGPQFTSNPLDLPCETFYLDYAMEKHLRNLSHFFFHPDDDWLNRFVLSLYPKLQSYPTGWNRRTEFIPKQHVKSFLDIFRASCADGIGKNVTQRSPASLLQECIFIVQNWNSNNKITVDESAFLLHVCSKMGVDLSCAVGIELVSKKDFVNGILYPTSTTIQQGDTTASVMEKFDIAIQMKTCETLSTLRIDPVVLKFMLQSQFTSFSNVSLLSPRLQPPVLHSKTLSEHSQAAPVHSQPPTPHSQVPLVHSQTSQMYFTNSSSPLHVEKNLNQTPKKKNGDISKFLKK